MAAPSRINPIDAEIAEDCSCFYADPLGWVYWAFPWGEGELEGQDGPDEWQADFLRQWGKEIEERGFDGITPVPPIQFGIASGHGIGKAQRLDDVVETPQGQRLWGDLQPGDTLFGRDGQPTTIIGTQCYKKAPMYRVTFSDGTFIDVSSGHLWTVRGRNERRTKRGEWSTMETIELVNRGVKRANGLTQARQWEIPTYRAVIFPDTDQPVDPYVLGVWLGDGSKHGGGITSNDPEIFESIRQSGYALGNNRHTGDGSVRTHVAFGLKVQLRDAGILGCTTSDCCVPSSYKYASVKQREAILQGLLDTDGWVESSGTVAFGSISQKLNEDVVWLARSLGLVARNNGAKTKWYTDSHGQRRVGKPFYTSTITWDGIAQLFRLHRKQNKLTKPQIRYTTRWIDNIEPIGDYDCMCVTVDRADGLYLAKDFVVTHNSALTAWIILFIASTRPFSKGIVTANTSDQLRTKTWSELGKWRRLCLTGHWFEYNNGRGSMSLYHHAHAETWRVDAQTCREENSESFAGLHCANSTPYYIFDEGSAVPDKIYEVAEGGKTDGEPMHFVFGNPTRNTGRFHDIFHKQKHRWITRQIDSRSAKMTNKALLQQWIDDYGLDSDFVRVRVLGRFPKAGDMQFIPNDIVAIAAARGVIYLPDDPLICGVDVARGGEDNNMVQFRRGFDAKSEKAYRIPGEKTRDSMKLVSKLCDIFDRHKPNNIFLDSGGLGGPIGDRLRQLGYPVVDVGFGDNATDEKLYKSRTAEMWARMRDWLFAGGAIKDHPDLESDLTHRLYDHNDKTQLVLERKKDMKARGLASPDWGDALALTFAEKVPPLNRSYEDNYRTHSGVVKKKVVRNVLDRLDCE